MSTAQFYQEQEVLGPLLTPLMESALAQEFGQEHPEGLDNGLRPGNRVSTVIDARVSDWDGFDKFMELVGPKLTTYVRAIDPEQSIDCKPDNMQLVKTETGGYFNRHIDADYPWMPGNKTSFVYYMGSRLSFSGGELEFDDGTEIDPADDSLVVFNGMVPHRMRPVVGDNAIRLTIAGYYAPPGYKGKDTL